MESSNKIHMAWDSLTLTSFMTSRDHHQRRKRSLRQVITYVILLTCSLSPVPVLSQAAPELQALNTKFAEISDAYYKDAAKNLAGTTYIKKDLSSLRTHVLQLRSQDKALANAVLLANFSLVLNKIGSKSTPFFLQQLLDHDIWSSAKQLADKALLEGSSLTSSRVNYLLGEYFFDRHEFSKTFSYLSAIESSEALTPKQRDYATLMFGIALQKSKKHRQALKIYERIEAGSYYYGYAQLNAAVGFIRQGWWTDAHISIENALKKTPPDALQEISNRLLLVLAYSQLQNEFYRNARETFRKIALDSIYVNSALLGIGLCALNQKDYPGAINAFTRLRNIDASELPVLEAHLMLPYTLDLMNDTEAAAEGYGEAISYYEVKLRELELESMQRRAQHTPFTEQQLQSQPKLIVQKFKNLQSFDKQQSSAALRKQISSLESAFRSQINAGLSHAVKEKADYIKSYTSQAQYGLAKLYDNQ